MTVATYHTQDFWCLLSHTLCHFQNWPLILNTILKSRKPRSGTLKTNFVQYSYVSLQFFLTKKKISKGEIMTIIQFFDGDNSFGHFFPFYLINSQIGFFSFLCQSLRMYKCSECSSSFACNEPLPSQRFHGKLLACTYISLPPTTVA